MIEFIVDREIYEKVILERVFQANSFLWLATSDLKDLHIQKGKRVVPFLELISELCKKGVSVRLIHAKEPGPAFRTDFDRYPALIDGLERLLCPRVHFKSIVVDGEYAYCGSANLTGAGVGAKSSKKRNFENGIVTDERKLISSVMDQFDKVWMGYFCEDCGRTAFCADRKIMT